MTEDTQVGRQSPAFALVCGLSGKGRTRLVARREEGALAQGRKVPLKDSHEFSRNNHEELGSLPKASSPLAGGERLCLHDPSGAPCPPAAASASQPASSPSAQALVPRPYHGNI